MTAVHERETLRSPERVLSTIAATSRIEGMVAPRWLSFDEPRDGEPMAVLSLTWKSLGAMRPWLTFFAAEPLKTYRRADGSAHYSAYADHHGWSVSLNAVESARCDCGAEQVHMVGCAVALAEIPVVVVDVPYVPVAMPTGDAANADECARLNGETPEHLADHFADPAPLVHWLSQSGHNMCFDRRVETQGTRDVTKATCPDCREVYSYTDMAIDKPIPLLPVDLDEPVPYLATDPRVHHVPTDVHPRHVSLTHDTVERPVVPIVDHTPGDAGPLVERDDNAAIAHLLPVANANGQASFAQAPERLDVQREAEVTQLVEALLSEVTE